METLALRPAASPSVETQPASGLTAAQLDSWNQSGFLSLRHVTSAKDIANLRRTCERLIEEKAGFKEGAMFDALGGSINEPPRFTQVINPHNYARELKQSEFIRNAHVMAKQLLGPNARFATDLLLIKPPHTGGATPWHQDEAFRDPNYDRHDISFWLPLQPVDEVNGCMHFIPGSHLGPILEHRLLNNDPKVHALECCGDFDPDDAVPCPLPVGGATLHNGRTLHYATPNRSAAPRFAYVVIFDIPPTPAKEVRTFPWRDNWRTERQEREANWRRSGGMVVEAWRRLSQMNMRDYRRVVIYAKRFLSRKH